jgi:hypothetical protein
LVADYVSNSIDFHDYEVVPEKFEFICQKLQKFPEVDLFANAYNAKCHTFFSATFEPGSAGIDAFCYDWSKFYLSWIFVQPSMIGRALLFAQACKAYILILIPQWKFSYFYPILQQLKLTRAFRNVAVFDGKSLFRGGFDANTIFSENYKGNVEIWELDFK